MEIGTVVEWRDGGRTRHGRVVGEEQPGYLRVEAEDGTRWVLPAGRLTIVEPSP